MNDKINGIEGINLSILIFPQFDLARLKEQRSTNYLRLFGPGQKAWNQSTGCKEKSIIFKTLNLNHDECHGKNEQKLFWLN